MSRLREGRANTARGAAHFLRETMSRVRYGGARGQLTVRADSGFYTHAVVAVCRRMDVGFSITIRQNKSLHNLIEAIPEDAWTPIPYWMDGADVAETTYRACLRSSTEGFDLVRSKRYRVSTASLIVVYRSTFRCCYPCRRTILPQTGARRLLSRDSPDQSDCPALGPSGAAAPELRETEHRQGTMVRLLTSGLAVPRPH